MYKLIWSEKALYDLDKVYELLSEKSKEAAIHTIELILRKADQLIEFPNSGPVESNLAHMEAEYRYLVKGYHKLIYRADKLSVFIVRVFDTRKDPLKMEP